MVTPDPVNLTSRMGGLQFHRLMAVYISPMVGAARLAVSHSVELMERTECMQNTPDFY